MPLSSPSEAVKRAIWFFWASYAVTILSWVIAFLMPAPEELRANAEALGITVHALIELNLVALCIWIPGLYLFLLQIAKGRNWARIVCLIYWIIAVPMTISRFLHHHNVTDQAISIVTNLFYLGFSYYALYILFTAPGKILFQKKAVTAPADPITNGISS